MADNLLDMLAFVRVVDAGSLSSAARDLNLSLAVISRKLARPASGHIRDTGSRSSG